MTKTINIIGAGCCGKAIAKLIATTACGQIQSVLNSTFESSLKACEFIGSGKACAEIQQLKPADIYLIATPDSSVENVCNLLVREHNFASNAIIMHVSGTLTAKVLHAAKLAGCLTASIHPIKSFADPAKSVKNFAGTFCAYEGDMEAFVTVAAIFKSIGGEVFPIDGSKKPLYHVAAVFCCNYLITLSYIANQCYAEVGVPKEIVTQIVQSLMQDALGNLKHLPHVEALSGPIARGDIDTLQRHKDALANTPDLKHIYEELGKQTILLTKHDNALKKSLKNLLTSIS